MIASPPSAQQLREGPLVHSSIPSFLAIESLSCRYGKLNVVVSVGLSPPRANMRTFDCRAELLWNRTSKHDTRAKILRLSAGKSDLLALLVPASPFPLFVSPYLTWTPQGAPADLATLLANRRCLIGVLPSLCRDHRAVAAGRGDPTLARSRCSIVAGTRSCVRLDNRASLAASCRRAHILRDWVNPFASASPRSIAGSRKTAPST